jgi:hypothetical protein
MSRFSESKRLELHTHLISNIDAAGNEFCKCILDTKDEMINIMTQLRAVQNDKHLKKGDISLSSEEREQLIAEAKELIFQIQKTLEMSREDKAINTVLLHKQGEIRSFPTAYDTIKQLLPFAEQPFTPTLTPFVTKIKKMFDKMEEFTVSAGAKTGEKSRVVKEADQLEDRWELLYQKIKYLMQGCLIEQNDLWKTFFADVA